MAARTAEKKRLLLLGGGHAHLEVVRKFCRRPIAGTQVILVNDKEHFLYSGMLPGVIAGHYALAQAQVNLRRLCRGGNVEFIRDTASGIDLNLNRVRLLGNRTLSFDIASIDVGSISTSESPPSVHERAIPVKPISGLIEHWRRVVEQAASAPDLPRNIIFVGGGAAGVELLLAARHRLCCVNQCPHVAFQLMTDSATILPDYNPRTRRCFEQILRRRNVSLHFLQHVNQLLAGEVVIEGSNPVPFDHLFWAAGPGAPAWIGESGFATDKRGFIAVDESLKSVSHPQVFAVGDVAAFSKRPLPKAGVYAVRQAPVLAENLRSAIAGAALKPFRPQRKFLNIISAGDRFAVATRGRWSVAGKWVWHWKDRIDRRWIGKYQSV